MNKAFGIDGIKDRLELGVYEALMQVWTLGKDDNKEHFIALRDGKIAAFIHGDEDTVSLRDARMSGAVKRGDILIHNHPSYTSLSNCDWGVSSGFSSPIYAIAQDKSVYRGVARVHNQVLQSELADLYWSLDEIAMLASESVGKTDRFNGTHWTNLLLARRGMADYDYALGEQTYAMVAAVNARLKGNQRD